MNYFFISLAFISFQVFGSEAYVPHALTLDEGAKEFNFNLDVFQTTSVVTEDGEALSLKEGTSYQRANFGFTGSYGFTNDFQGYLGIKGRYIQARDEFSGEESSYNQGALSAALIGFKYGFKENKGMKYTLEGYYQKSLVENSDYEADGVAPETLSMGDDTRELAIGANIYSKSKSNNFLTARIFYRDPSQKLSSEIFSQIDYNLAWKYFSFGIGVENNFSLGKDNYSNDPENKPQTYNGPSEYFNSVNRSWTAPYLQMNLAFGGTWRFESRMAQVTTGNSTDKGPRIFLSFVKRTSTNKDKENFKKTDAAFKQYRVEGLVTKVSKSREGCLINKGLVDGVAVGQRVDFFHFDYVDGNKLIGSGIVSKTQASRSLVKIVRKFSKKRVEAGTVARIQQLTEK